LIVFWEQSLSSDKPLKRSIDGMNQSGKGEVTAWNSTSESAEREQLKAHAKKHTFDKKTQRQNNTPGVTDLDLERPHSS